MSAGNKGFFFGRSSPGPRKAVVMGTEPKYDFRKEKSDSQGESMNAMWGKDYYPHILELIGKRVQVVLRDDKIMIGDLESVGGGTGHVVLSHAVERIIVGNQYGDIVRGVFMFRGDNIAIVGEIDAQGEEKLNSVMKKVQPDEIFKLLNKQVKQQTEKQAKHTEARKQMGIGEGLTRPIQDKFEFPASY